jgi:hypothetical protein
MPRSIRISLFAEALEDARYRGIVKQDVRSPMCAVAAARRTSPSEPDFMVNADSFIDLADQLGCA